MQAELRNEVEINRQIRKLPVGVVELNDKTAVFLYMNHRHKFPRIPEK